ncbi:MAG: hypothetical protein ACP5O1_12730 [Phycisphaerae bacterium]
MKHQVNFSIPTRDLGKADVEFNVAIDGNRLGTLRVSQGSVVWYPSGSTYGHKATWTDFGKAMSQFVRSERR